MKTPSDKKEKIIKLAFKVLFCAIAAYMLYVMISYYTEDRESRVNLNLATDDSNIIKSISATYVMKENEGQLILETSEKTNDITYTDMVGKAFEIKSIGNAVTSATLTIIYDDKNIDYDESDIKLMRINDNGNPVSYKSAVDTAANTVTADFFSGGIWYLAKP